MANIKEILNNWRNFSFGPFSLSMMDGQSLGKTLIKATLGSAGVRIAGMFVTFFLGVLLARFMGVEQYGIYGTVMSIMAIMAVPAQFGLPQLATKEISVAHGRGDFDQIRTVMVWFMVLISIGIIASIIIAYLISGIWVNAMKDDILPSYFWGVGLVPVISILAFGMAALRGLSHVIGAQFYDTLVRPLAVMFMLLFLIGYGVSIDAKTVLILQVTSGIITIIICGVHLKKVLPTVFFSETIHKFRSDWLKTTTPMAATEVLRVLDGNYPILLLGLLATIIDVGLFRIAIAMVVFVGFPSTLLNLVVMPYVANAYAQNDRNTLQKLATYTAAASFTCTAIIMLFIYFFGEAVISFLFGEEYSGAWLILVLLGAAYLINSFFGSLATILNMCGGEKTVATAFFIGPVIGIGISIILFPYYQSYAVAIAMIIAETLRNLWMSYAAKKKLQLNVSILSILKY